MSVGASSSAASGIRSSPNYRCSRKSFSTSFEIVEKTIGGSDTTDSNSLAPARKAGSDPLS